MSVRGSKNKIILYVASVCSIILIILLYQNASQRLGEMAKSYERCHLNEESLSAQLQVNLEYKVRLEKSLQQEKSEHAQIKEELQNKLKEERQARERENVEAVNKFKALQQKLKLLQGQQEDLYQECNRIRQSRVTEIEEKKELENLVQNLRDELNLIKKKNSEIEQLKYYQLKAKYDHLEKSIKEGKIGPSDDFKKQDSLVFPIKLPEKLPLNTSNVKPDANDIQQQSETGGKVDFPGPLKSSTSAKKADQELFPSGRNSYVNSSTPMINPDAVNSQDKILSAGPVPQPKQEPLQNYHAFSSKENVGAKPDGMENERRNDEGPRQGVLRPPDLIKHFAHVPAIQQYKDKMDADKNNNAGEIGDEGEPLARNEEDREGKPFWREGKAPNNEMFVNQLAFNEIPKKPVYHYQGDYDGRKEEGEDDDDVDPLEYNNEKNQQQPVPLQQQQQQPPHLQQEDRQNGIHFKMQDSVMIQPK